MVAPAAVRRTKLYVQDRQTQLISYLTRYQRAKMIVFCFMIQAISSTQPAVTAKPTCERLLRKLAQTSHYRNSKLTSQAGGSSRPTVLIWLTCNTSRDDGHNAWRMAGEIIVLCRVAPLHMGAISSSVAFSLRSLRFSCTFSATCRGSLIIPSAYSHVAASNRRAEIAPLSLQSPFGHCFRRHL